MTEIDSRLSRRRFLQASAAVGATVSLGGITAACNVVGQTGAGRDVQLDDLGRPLHRHPAQGHRGVRQDRPPISASWPATPRGSPSSRRSRAQLDKISGDALWVPDAYYKEGLIEPFDINELKVASQLYSVRPRVRDLDEAGGLPRLPVRVVADQHLLQPAKFATRRPTHGRCSSTPSTRAASSSRSSPRRSSPTWARRRVSTTSTT